MENQKILTTPKMYAERIIDWELPEVTNLRTEAEQWERLYNKASNERAELLFALRDLQREVRSVVKMDVKKRGHYSLMVADACATKVILKAEGKL